MIYGVDFTVSTLKKKKRYFYGDIGCCLTCNNQIKEELENRNQILYEVYIGEKFYSCLCKEGKYTRCSWYYHSECQRKYFGSDNIAGF